MDPVSASAVQIIALVSGVCCCRLQGLSLEVDGSWINARSLKIGRTKY